MVQPLDRDIGSCRALVIDGNPTSRSILATQLRDFGVGHIVQCGRINDARRQLEVREFDIVLCDYHFQTGQYSGQELLDDLRRVQLLPFSTVFIMVTAEASYAKVAEAAEGALDGYLLKPHTATALGARLKQARHRQRVLKDIFEAIEAKAFDHAARLCSLAGQHQNAVRALLEQGRATLNGKLLDMARLSLQRHRAQIDDAAELSRQIDELRGRYAGAPALPAIAGERGRQAGGLSLRTAA